jgi:hypothetical protein
MVYLHKDFEYLICPLFRGSTDYVWPSKDEAFFVIFENSAGLDSSRDADFRDVFRFSVTIWDQKLEHVEVS